MSNRDEWDLDSAMAILQHQTVDAKLWAEAVEWLLLYGPPEIQELLAEASATATHESFPELEPTGYTRNGQPCYDIKAIAQSLNISEQEAKEIITKKEFTHSTRYFIDKDETFKLQ